MVLDLQNNCDARGFPSPRSLVADSLCCRCISDNEPLRIHYCRIVHVVDACLAFGQPWVWPLALLK